MANAATNAESIDTESTNTDNINKVEIENDKSEDIVMSENVTPGETSTEDVPSPLLYGRKTIDSSKVKTSRKRRPVRV